MKHLPFENFEIHTNLSSDEVFYRLRAATDKERNWWILANKPFWGQVYRHNFKIRRYRGWWRNFTLVVLGETQSEDLGCCLQIRIRLSWFGYLVDALILGFIWLSFLMGNANLVVQKIQTGSWQVESLGEWLLSLLLFIIFFAFMYLISVGTFKYESLYVKEYLLKLSATSEESIIYRDTILGITESQIIKALFIIPIVISLGWMIYKLLF
jgi:hypothetical protein